MAMTPAILILKVFMSGIAAGVATYWLNISKERLLFLGQKSEELYRTLEAVDFELSCFYSKRYSLVGGSPGTAGAENMQRAKAHFATVRMLIGLYFPALTTALSRACAAASTAQRSLEALEVALEAEPRHLINELDVSVCEMKDSFDALKGAVLAAGRAANQRKFFAPNARRVLQVHP
jgi:hypothetical protein